MKSVRRLAAATVAVMATFAISGCDYEGLNSVTLPGTTGGDGYEVTLEIENALDLVPNSPVLVNDLNAGTVVSVDLKGYQPVVTVRLKKDVELPVNSVAKIGQTSLLGARHVEINAPATEDARGTLKEGTVIPRSQTGTYPSTEDILASVSALLNGGGLAQIKTITTELNNALGGREDTVRDLLTSADTFTASLDQQKTDITTAIDSLDRLGSSFSAGNDTIADALEVLPPALDVLNAERTKLVDTFDTLGEFGVAMDDLVDRSGDDLVRNIDNLGPVVKGLADAGPALVDSLQILPGLIFKNKNYDEYLRGDYINLWATVDLGLDTLDNGILAGTPLAGTLGGPNGLLGLLMKGNSGDIGNPLTDPLSPPAAETTPASPGSVAPGGGEPAAGPDRGAPTPSPSENPISDLFSGLFGGGAK